MAEAAHKRLLASYGRRHGRRLRTGKQELMGRLLPELLIHLPEHGMLEPAALFPDKKEYWLEIGFGGGEHLAHQAERNPQVGIIGCEPYVNGIAGLLKHIHDHRLENIRIYTDDARRLMAVLPDRSLSRVFMLYPDPWPKRRHHKRRLVSAETLDELARVMKPGSELRLATDHADYATWMLERLLAHRDFTWPVRTSGDWLNPPGDWVTTRYEQKRLAGMPTYLNFLRR